MAPTHPHQAKRPIQPAPNPAVTNNMILFILALTTAAAIGPATSYTLDWYRDRNNPTPPHPNYDDDWVWLIDSIDTEGNQIHVWTRRIP